MAQEAGRGHSCPGEMLSNWTKISAKPILTEMTGETPRRHWHYIERRFDGNILIVTKMKSMIFFFFLPIISENRVSTTA